MRQLINALPHITVSDERRQPPRQPAELAYAAAEIHGLTPEARRKGIKNPLAIIGALEAWLPGAHRALGADQGHPALCRPRRAGEHHRHRSASASARSPNSRRRCARAG